MYFYGFMGLMGLALALYLSSKERRQKLWAKWNLLRMLWALLKGSESGAMSGMMGKPSEISFSICDTGRAAIIKYERLGQSYTYLGSFDRSYVVKMIPLAAELIRPEKEPLNITLQPGMAYHITAAELGGTGIRITNQDTGVYKIYGPCEQPGFAIAVHE
jgi:hypothetical protein